MRKIFSTSAAFICLLLLCGNFAKAQFTVSGAVTGTNSPGPITVNGPTSGATPALGDGIYIGKGAWQTGSGGFNTAVGVGALSSTSSTPAPGAYNNTAVGYHALRLAASGRVNVAVGSFALAGATGSNNTAVGSNALSAAGNSGEQNTALGVSASAANTTGMYNISVGQAALSANATGSQNVAIGVNALGTHTASIQNTAVGFQSSRLATGNSNTGLGSHTLWTLSTGNSNTVVGTNSMRNNSSGSNNSIVGFNSFNVYGTGDDNCVLGANALSTLTSGSFNVAIGSGSQVQLPTGSSQLSIQNVIYGSAMSSATNGRVAIGGFTAPVGSGSVYPNQTAKLDVVGTLRVRTVTPGTNTSNQYLFVDGDGMVARATLPTGVGTTNVLTTAGNTITSTVNTIGSTITAPNIYTINGTLTGNRMMTMNNFNLHFNTGSGVNGRIYIGATPVYPVVFGDYRLYVEGGILTERVKIALRSGGNWADYVFDEKYKLMPLNKVEAYVKENKHLPGIASADELVKVGIDVTEMLAKQLGKIEELTLYIIEQNKALEKQNAEISSLKTNMELIQSGLSSKK